MLITHIFIKGFNILSLKQYMTFININNTHFQAYTRGAYNVLASVIIQSSVNEYVYTKHTHIWVRKRYGYVQ